MQDINRILLETYGERRWECYTEPLDELVLTVLSQHTSDSNAARAFHQLRGRFDSWPAVMAADAAEIAEAITVGGLANIKSKRIKQILEVIAERRGSLDLSFLADMHVEEARQWLETLPGVGPKTAACVLLFACHRPAMPVDTHVHRVSRRLGLVDEKTTAEETQTILEKMVPPDQFLSFHVNMIEHGRRICKAQRPDCPNCPLKHLCYYYQKTGGPK